MVQTRSSAKRIESRKDCDDERPRITQDTSVKLFPGNPSSSLAKKRRGQDMVSPKKRRRGKPGEICQLNLDVLFLIAAYVHPIDLLNLARTCRSLRQLLMDKSSTFVWKAAHRQVDDLPDCPADLTEPEYANLVFYARCHGCGKYATTVLWEIRRRYCLDCKIERLFSLFSCHKVIRRNNVLAREHITIEGETTIWVDREQMEAFMDEYNHSPDEKQFLEDKMEQYVAICKHARQCEKWQRKKASERKVNLEARRRERDNSIFGRLKQLGYEREIAYFGFHPIQMSCKALFGKSKPLTDKEWNRIWPECVETMNSFRYKRLERDVYPSRRRSLSSEYTNYVMHPPPNAPTFDLFPHVTDVACSPPFRDAIRNPEETLKSDELFDYAFTQLPEFVDKWRKKLDVEVAEIVRIPSHLSFDGTPSGQIMELSSTTSPEPLQAATDKLRLACALFRGGTLGTFTHPEVFITMLNYMYPRFCEDDSERSGSIWSRYGIKYISEAPYVIRACGLDPSVATADDMDRRNARLKCLLCKDLRVRRWRDAVWHAHGHRYGPENSKLLRWQVVDEEHIPAIEATELSFMTKGWTQPCSRCLLCLPCVGGSHVDVKRHLKDCHDIKYDDVQQGVHYVPLGMAHELCSVEMVEEDGKVMFREPHYFEPYR